MPLIRRSSKVGRQKLVKPKHRDDLDLSLADELSEPMDDFWQYSMLLYGEKKIGKTTLCSELPVTQFLMTEPGHRALRIYKNECPTWKHVRGYLKLLEEDDQRSKPKWQTVVIDTIDRAYKLCFDYMCVKMAITHPHDEEDYGKSWGNIRSEFEAVINRLVALRKGVVFISHAKLAPVRHRDGTVYDMLCPTLSGQAMEVMAAIVDTIAYYGYNGSDRQLIIRGDDFLMAGTRLEEHFVTKVKRRPIRSIDMGSNKGEAYANLMKAYNNELVEVGEVPVVAPRNKGKRR